MRCFSLFVGLLLILVLTQGTVASEPKNSQSTGEKYFFPYGACIVYTIQKFRRIQSTLGTDYDILEVQINQVLRGPFTNGQSMGLSFDSSPEFLPKKPTSEMIGQRCVLAFNPLGFAPGKDSRCSMEDPYAPFPYQRFTEVDVTKLGRQIDSVRLERADLKPAMQSFLEQRWTAKRLADFCRPELRNLSSSHHLNGEMAGQLPLGSKKGGTAEWRALLSDGVITYEVTVHKDNAVWDVEMLHPTLVPFSDDDFLAYRIRRTLESCFEGYRLTRKFDEAIKPHSPFREGSFRVLRNSKKDITALECKELDGTIVTALLDSGLSIKSILVNGKADESWNMMLKDVNKNIDLMNAGGIRQSWDDIKDPRARQLLLYYRLLMVLWPITIGIILVGTGFGLWRLLRRKPVSEQKFPRKPWFIAAVLVPPFFIGLQQLIINYVFRGNMSHTENWIWNVVSLGLLFGIIPFMVAFTLIGFLQPVWRDPDLTKFSKAWFLKRSIPWLLISFAIWCSLLSAFSLTMMG